MLIQSFLENIADECLSNYLEANTNLHRSLFISRFNPSNRLDTHRKLREKLAPELQDISNPSQMMREKIFVKLKEIYEQEMVDDGFDISCIIESGQREKGAWKKVYKWLWHHKFPRWGKEKFASWGDHWFWGGLVKSQVENNSDWINFQPVVNLNCSNQVDLPRPRLAQGDTLSPQPPRRQIATNIRYVIELNFPNANNNLLLLNREGQSLACMCPSKDFAPNNTFSNSSMTIPHKGATYQYLKFERQGAEEFLAIVTSNSLSENNLRENNDLDLLDSIRQFWLESLEQNKNWQVFHQLFEVVN